SLGVTTHSPFRKDQNPSFSIIATKTGKLHHTDFADSSKRGTCLDFVMQLHHLSFVDALRKVAHDFCLIAPDGSFQGGVRRPLEDCREQKPKEPTLIQVRSRRFDSADLAYWQQYGITEEELKANDVYAVRKLYLNGEVIPFPSTELIFGYLFDDKWKIYRPLGDRKTKWLSNVAQSTLSGKKKIVPGTKIALITKSKKDEMVLSKIIPTTCSTQNESEFSITKENIDVLQENCEKIYVNFDSDDVGVQACKYYNQFGFGWINCPRGYTKPDGTYIKDFADLVRYHGMEAVTNHFKSKKLI